MITASPSPSPNPIPNPIPNPNPSPSPSPSPSLQPERGLGDHGERALRADQQARQVVPR